MIDDLNRLDERALIEADLCIVGAGAAGISIAQALAGTGLRICLVESGGLEFEPETQALYAGASVGHPIVLDEGRYRVLGGSTSRWTGRCARLDPVDFMARPWVPHSGWPISQHDLAGHYAAAARVCGFRASWATDAAAATALNVTLPRFAPDGVTPFFWRYAPRGGWTFQDWGKAYRDVLAASRDLRVLLHANLTTIAADAQGRHVDHVVVRSLAGRSVRIRARAFALCCGGIENARLLLASGAEGRPALGNAFGQVGRYFQQHPRGLTARMRAAPATARRLQDLFAIFGERDGLRYEIGFGLSERAQRRHGLLNASAVLQYPRDEESAYEQAKSLVRELKAGRIDKGTARRLPRALRGMPMVATNVWRRAVQKRHALQAVREIKLVVDLEQVPDPESRVTLADTLDRLGQRQAKVDWRVAELERRTAAHLTTAIAAELARLDLGRLQPEPWLTQSGPIGADDLAGTFHHIGTTRMAADPADGVVDRDCRVHGVDNLYLGGCSVFATGGHANPTLTIVALALRLADHLKAELAPYAAAA